MWVLFVLCAFAGCPPPPPAPDAGSEDAGDPGTDAGTDDGDDGGDVVLPVFDGGSLLLVGTVVTPLDVFEGQVLVEGTRITCVSSDGGCDLASLDAGATRVDTNGIIAPGLIDTHNHIIFDVFDDDDWHPPRLYQNHDQWTTDPGYQLMLDVKHCLANDSQGKPTWCANTAYGTAAGSLRCEMNKFGELKGLIAGTTSIVGLPGIQGACYGSLSRSIDSAANGLGIDKIRSSALFPPSAASVSSTCAGFANGTVSAFLVHCGEGVDARSLGEYSTLVGLAGGCAKAPQTTITHGTAFSLNEFNDMASHGMKLTWSPHSNVSLYGSTMDAPTAVDAGVLLALGPDWSMGGSQNMLEELRFAQAWDHTHWNDRFTAKDLVTMATLNGAAVVGQSAQLGQLAPGFLADLFVVRGDRQHPYQAIIDAKPKDVALVMVGGLPQYGDAMWVGVSPIAPSCEFIDVCGTQKFLCMAIPGATAKLDQTWQQVRDTLNVAMTTVDAVSGVDGGHFAPLPPLVRCQ